MSALKSNPLTANSLSTATENKIVLVKSVAGPPFKLTAETGM